MLYLYFMRKQDHKELLQAAFSKASAELQERGNARITKTQCAEELANYIEQEMKFPVNERTLRNYWNESEENLHFQIPNATLVNGLSKYLGYRDYSVYLVAKAVKKGTYTDGKFKKRLYVLAAIVLVLLVMVIGFYIYIQRERWMMWQEDHYIEVSFDAHLHDIGKIKVYKEERISHFKKKDPDSINEFFSPSREPLIWYGKNKNGVLEYFTDVGLHPETGKTLKPITQYMINKYILPDRLTDSLSIP